MLFSKETLEDNCTIGIWKMEESEDELLSLFNEKKSEYKEQIKQFSYAKRKLEFLTSRYLLKELTGIENNIQYDGNNKPSLVDNNLNISISHTNGYLSVITHPFLTVGIDIEQKRDKILRLKHKFLSEKELEYLDPKQETEHLLLHWSAKETMFKMMGETEVDFILHTHILPFPLNKNGIIRSYETKSINQQNFILHYRIYDDYVLVWGTSSIK